MASYDGSIRINTDINTNITSQMMKLKNSIAKLENEASRLRARLQELGSAKIPTTEYTEVQKQIEATEKKLAVLTERKEKFLATGGTESSVTFRRMQYDIEQLQNSLPYLKSELQDLVDTGEAFTLGKNTDEFASTAEKLQEIENSIDASKMRFAELAEKQESAAVGFDKMAAAAKKAGKSMSSGISSSKKAVDGVSSSLKRGLKTILKYGLGIRSLYLLVNKLRTALKEGLENFVQYSDGYNQAVSSLKSACTQLKNSFAAAFAPIIQMAVPHLISLINHIITAVNWINQLIAALTGASTWTKATAVQEDYADSLNGTASAAKKAAGALASFDTLEVLNKKEDSSGSGAGVSAQDMFEEVPVDNKLLDWIDKIKEFLKPILDYLEKLKNIFMEGFWDGLGDWEYRWESIKDSIASIKESLKDIFTDPAVLAAADSWAQSVAYMLGSLVGSMASIGLTIATNLLGGIAKYLEQNKERIKEYLISMFDIWEDINYLFAELFQSIAYVFEAFASESGQQLTANIIGIFTDAFMGVTELASELFRDIANIIIQPFVDNKEGFRTALEGFLGVLADITGTIKQGIDDTFDKLNEVYDEHLKPFFDSVAQGLSDLVGKFLEFWNGNVQPILEEWAAKFDTLWKEHIQPLIDNIIGLLGDLADMFKALWENILEPLIAWIIEYIAPVVASVIDFIMTVVAPVVGFIADTINAIIDVIRSIVQFLTDVFSGDWEAAWEDISSIPGNFVEKMKTAGKNLIDGVIGGIKEKWEDLKSNVMEVAGKISDWFKEKLGINSPSTVMAENGEYLVEGLKNGISDNIEAVYELFTAEKWTELGRNIVTGLMAGIEPLNEYFITAFTGMLTTAQEQVTLFIEYWTETFTLWLEENMELYFGYDAWYLQWENLILAYTEVWNEFYSLWTANMNTWWKTVVEPYFTVAQWKLFGENMKNGIYQGFKAIVSQVGNIMNTIIGIFNAGIKNIEGAINDLIDQFNSVASALEQPTLSSVHARTIPNVTIPALADGAVIRGGDPFAAILGDQRRGQTNVEAPLSTIEQAVGNVLDSRGYGNTATTLNLYMDSEKVATTTLDAFLSELTRRGYDLEPIGG